MNNLPAESASEKVYSKKKMWGMAGLLLLAAAVAVLALAQIGMILYQRWSSKVEYDALRVKFSPAAVAGQEASPEQARVQTLELQQINPDYAGWMTLEGTGMDYPVVQGKENSTYLNTTFEGVKNPLGAIFMDANSVDGFSGAHTIVYGHNGKDGSMFAGLMKYSDPAYLAEHPRITVRTAAGEVLEYQIFAARACSAEDEIYAYAGISRLALPALAEKLGAPEGTQRLLTLSTCTNGDKDQRMVVFAAITA